MSPGDLAETVDADALRRAMSHFATGVTVVTAPGERRPFGSTANAVASVSLRPPLIMVALRRESETLAVVLRAGHFGLNILHEGQRRVAHRFAQRGEEAWDGVGWTPGHGHVPLLDGALATLECAVHDLTDAGDHQLVIGEVIGVAHPPTHVPPLVFYRGSYAGLAARVEATRLPSRLGDLAMQPIDIGLGHVTCVAVLVGEPHGTTGCPVYVHRGCTVGDALHAADCARRRALDAALDRMSADGRGVVVYHRDERNPFAGCCLDADEPEDASGQRTVRLALQRALEQLELEDAHVLVPREQLYRAAGGPVDDYVAL